MRLPRRTRDVEEPPHARKNCACSKRCCLPPASRSTRRRWRGRLPNGVDVKAALAALKAEYATRGVNLVRVGRKWMFRTADDLSWLLTKETVETRKLSRAAIETLAIIAYHQPVTRAEIEEIRGVATAAGTLDVLLQHRLDPPARPAQGAGPADHLRHQRGSSSTHFGLEEVGDLPGLDELKGAGLLEGNMPAGFAVPMPSDDTTLRDDEDPLEPGDLDLGLAPPPARGVARKPVRHPAVRARSAGRDGCPRASTSRAAFGGHLKGRHVREP